MLAEGGNNPILSLPGKPYIDAEIYREEQDRIFSRNWIYAGHVNQFTRGSDSEIEISDFESAAIEEFHGLVFVNDDNAARPLHEQAPELLDDLCALAPDLPDLKFVHRTQALLEANWKVAIENFSECYHCEYLHQELFSSIVNPDTYRVEVLGISQRHFSRALSGVDKPYDFDDSDDQVFVAWWLWPNFAFQSYPGGRVHCWKWAPLDVAHTQVTVDWFMPSENLATWERDLIEHHARTTFAEDLPVIASVQHGLSSRGYHPGPLMIDEPVSQYSEHAVAAIQQLWREAMGAQE